MKENDTFRLLKPTSATVVGEQRTVIIPAGSEVTVVLILGDPNSPSAYEVKAYIAGEDAYGLATIESSDLPPIPKSTVINGVGNAHLAAALKRSYQPLMD